MSDNQQSQGSVTTMVFAGTIPAFVLSMMICSARSNEPITDMVIGAIPFLLTGLALGRTCPEGAESNARVAGAIIVVVVFLLVVSERFSGSPLATFAQQQVSAAPPQTMLIAVAIAVPALICLAANALGVEMGTRWRRRSG